MKKSDNMKQAMHEMFGVGSAPVSEAAEKPVEAKSVAPTETKTVVASVAPKPAVSLLAAGTAFEGTLTAKGDVEIAGEFKGSISSGGVVRLRSDIESGVTAGSLEMTGCVLTGDVVVNGTVTVDEKSRIVGNISAKELICAGEIAGDLKVVDSVRLDAKARVSGNIVTGAISVERGAAISGNVQIKTTVEAKG